MDAAIRYWPAAVRSSISAAVWQLTMGPQQQPQIQSSISLPSIPYLSRAAVRKRLVASQGTQQTNRHQTQPDLSTASPLSQARQGAHQ